MNKVVMADVQSCTRPLPSTSSSSSSSLSDSKIIDTLNELDTLDEAPETPNIVVSPPVDDLAQPPHPTSTIRSDTARALFESLSVQDPPPPAYARSSTMQPTEKVLRSVSDLTEKIRSILPDSVSHPRRGSREYDYTPVGMLSPPDSRRGSTNTDDLEAGGGGVNNDNSSFLSFLTSKRRQARQGRWAAVVLVMGGLVYFFISNMLISDWLDVGRSAAISAVEGTVGWLEVTSTGRTAATWMGTGIVPLPEDQSHVLVPVTADPPVELLQPIKRFHAPSLVDYYVNGRLDALPSSDMPNPTADMLYTFVNASSPILQEAMTRRRAAEGLPPKDGSSSRWRDNGELRGALRSGVHSLGEAVRKVHVISADFELDEPSPAPEGESIEMSRKDEESGEEYEWVETEEAEDIYGKWKMGQVPSWLDTTSEQDRLAWHFHSEIYRLPADDGVLDPRLSDHWGTEEEWKAYATPSFSSFSIETRLGWVKDLGENIIYTNDDMFLLNPLEITDYHHPLLGPIIRVTSELSLRVKGDLVPSLYSSGGEWGGLQHASLLLKNRFTPRARNYMLHMPKALTKSMLHETSVMFASELSVAATRGFRISTRGIADIHFPWLTSQYRMERWREALLWSWAVARMGGEDGVWGETARADLASLLNLRQPGDEDKVVEFHQQPRETIRDMEKIMEDNEWPFPKASNYAWTSLDGLIPEESGSWDVPRSCKMVPSQCLPRAAFSPDSSANQINATSVFLDIAFVDTHCGDCLIMGLINQSGPRGLSALLPRKDQFFMPTTNRQAAMWDRSEPMLPLVPRWEQGLFGIDDVVRPGQDLWEGSDVSERQEGLVSLQDWCVKLLSRYVYSLADSPTHFGMAHNVGELEKTFQHLDEHPNIAMTCINDDQPAGSGDEAARAFATWMQGRWGEVDAPWERSGAPWIEQETAAEEVTGGEE